MSRLVLLALTLISLLAPGTAGADVESAYRREFAFLEAEKHSLSKRLEAIEGETAQKVAAAKAEIDQLQGRVLALDLQAEKLQELLTEVEQDVDTSAEDADLIEGILQQAAALLEKGKLTLPEAAADDPQGELSQLRFAFQGGVSLLGRMASVRKEPGEFFAENGEKVSGTVVHLGQVATFGIADGVAGALAPAGGGALKVWPGTGSTDIARALVAGERPVQLSLFLYESLDNGVERKEEETLRQHIDAGGLIGWLIVWLGVLCGLMVLIRVVLLWRAAANTAALVERCTPLVEKKEFTKAIALCTKAKSAGGRVLAVTLQNAHRDRAELEDIISEAVLHETPTLERFGSLITVIAAVAPLLGLLGTVTGMIATFDIITEYGTGNPKLLSSGIAIALITTELGLVVAIPALIIGNLLSSWANGIKDGMDKAALRIINVAAGVRLSERPGAPEPVDNPTAVAGGAGA